MFDLIDREALLKGACNSCDGWCNVVDCDCLNCESDHRCDIVNDIIYAPSVDAVEVVRCKDCRWLYDGPDDYCCCNHRGLVSIKPDDFCSHGERRGENAAD